jgi:hypothetical protein
MIRALKEARLMNRFACWLLTGSLLLSGCGEADHSRVIPVKDDDSKARSSEKLPADLTTLKKIPMH